MTIVLASAAALTLLLLVVLLSRRRMETTRAILIHRPPEVVWEGIRDFGALHARHARGRPWLRIESTEILEGDGQSRRTVWRQRGRWAERPYWAEIELVAAEPLQRLTVRLRRDSLGTHLGLRRHRCELRLVPEPDGATKLVLALRAGLRGLRAPALARLAPDRLQPRLLDLAMRSVKVSVGEAPGAGDARRPVRAAHAGAHDEDAIPPPTPAPPMRDRL